MRLLTRSDFDGLACAVLLKAAGIIDTWQFVHPKDLQDGKIEVTKDDCLANVPFVKGCGLWFDHHSSEAERAAFKDDYVGMSRIEPSCAHVIYDYYGGKKKFGMYKELLEAVDKVDSANLTPDEILNPKGWVLLGFVMDPRTGLGRFRDFTISNYSLMEKMIDWCAECSIDEILAKSDVVERTELYFEQQEKFIAMLKEHTTISGSIIITDLRGEKDIWAGNRFLIYSLYPEQNLSVWLVSLRTGGCSVAVGHSIINRTSKLNVGSLMLKYGGGGHEKVGTCQFNAEEMNVKLSQLMKDIRLMNA